MVGLEVLMIDRIYILHSGICVRWKADQTHLSIIAILVMPCFEGNNELGQISYLGRLQYIKAKD